MEITKETRLESYIQRPATRAQDILRFMGHDAMTARQIAYGFKCCKAPVVRDEGGRDYKGYRESIRQCNQKKSGRV